MDLAEEENVRLQAELAAALAELQRLDDWFEEEMPAWNRKNSTPVDSAIELLDLMKANIPTIVRLTWEEVVRPALHILNRYGLRVLPPGTIVYGAKPSTAPERVRP